MQKRTWVKKSTLLVAAFAVVLSGFTSLLSPQVAKAAVKDLPYFSHNEDLYKQLSTHQHYWWLYSCFKNTDIDKVTKVEVDGWDFFEGSNNMAVLGGMYGNNDATGFYRNCSDQNMVKTAFGYMGLNKDFGNNKSASRNVFCMMTGSKFDGSSDNDKCLAGTGDGNWDNESDGDDEDKLVTWFKANANDPGINPASEYMRSYGTFMEGCEIDYINDELFDSKDQVPDQGDDEKYAVAVVVVENEQPVIKYVQGIGTASTKSIPLVANSDSAVSVSMPGQSRTCAELESAIASNASAYLLYLQANGFDDTNENETNPDGEEGAIETSCAIDGIGWIVCPVMTFIGKMNDAAFGFLEEILGIRPAVVNNEATRSAWAAFRDIANIAFVIAFMIIVYSQITSAGVSNYGIKKLLPRIVAAAILVNVSFYICAIAVDISNIVGSSVYSLFKDSIDIGSGITTTSWESSISDVLKIAATAIGVILLILMLTMAPAVLLAFVLIILILIARQAFVILLIVLAPLAFVAYLLPNTESWFKKWWKAFVAVLMVYPIVGLVFGASTLASNILMQVGQSGGEDEQLLQIIALGVLAVPLFAVPAILKGSLSAAGSVGTKIAGLADRSTRMSGKQLSNRAGDIRKDAGNRFKIASQDPENKWGRRLGGYSRIKNRREVGKRDRETAAKRAEELGYATNMIEKDADGNFTNRAVRMQKAAAGGAGVYNEKGQVRAEALATQRTFKQFDDDISAFKTTQTNDTHEALLKKATNANLSVEERSAAAGTIAGRSYRQGHNEMLDKVYEQMNTADAELRTAEASGDTASIAKAQESVGAVSAIQKQLIGDLKDKPFGLGDRAMGQLVEGKFGRASEVIDETTGEPKLDGNKQKVYNAPLASPREELRTRVGGKLNAQTVASLNPDDLKLIHEDAESGALKPDQMKNLITQIAAARANKDTAALIKPEANDKFNDIIKAATARGITVDTGTGPAAATPGLVLPGDNDYSRTGGGPTAQ